LRRPGFEFDDLIEDVLPGALRDHRIGVPEINARKAEVHRGLLAGFIQRDGETIGSEVSWLVFTSLPTKRFLRLEHHGAITPEFCGNCFTITTAGTVLNNCRYPGTYDWVESALDGCSADRCLPGRRMIPEPEKARRKAYKASQQA